MSAHRLNETLQQKAERFVTQKDVLVSPEQYRGIIQALLAEMSQPCPTCQRVIEVLSVYDRKSDGAVVPK